MVKTRRLVQRYNVPLHWSKTCNEKFDVHTVCVLFVLFQIEQKDYRLFSGWRSITTALGLPSVPHFTTLQKAFARLPPRLVRKLMQLAGKCQDRIASLDPTYFQLTSPSNGYCKRIDRDPRRDKFRKATVVVGCGNGFLLSAAEHRGICAFGIDISEIATELASKNAPNSQIKAGMAESIDYPNDYFDYLTCLGTLEHCLDIGKALSEIYRVTRKDAKICIMVPNRNYVIRKLQRQTGTEHGEANQQLFSLKEWHLIFNQNGFIVQKILQDKWVAHNIRVFGTRHPKDMTLRIIMKILWYFMPIRFTYQLIFICSKCNKARFIPE